MADAPDCEQVDAALALIDDVFATFLIPHDDADPMHAGWTRRASVRADVAQKWRDRRDALAARTPQPAPGASLTCCDEGTAAYPDAYPTCGDWVAAAERADRAKSGAPLPAVPDGEDDTQTDSELWIEDWSWSQVPPPLLAVAPTKAGDTHITMGLADPANGVGEQGELDWTPRRLTGEQAVQLANALLVRAKAMHSGEIPEHLDGCKHCDEEGPGSCAEGCPVRAAVAAALARPAAVVT